MPLPNGVAQVVLDGIAGGDLHVGRLDVQAARNRPADLDVDADQGAVAPEGERRVVAVDADPQRAHGNDVVEWLRPCQLARSRRTRQQRRRHQQDLPRHHALSPRPAAPITARQATTLLPTVRLRRDGSSVPSHPTKVEFTPEEPAPNVS